MTILRVLVASLVSLLFSGCYTTKQAWGQLSLLSSRQEVSVVMADPKVEPRVKERLQDLSRVLDHARHHDLDVGDAYSTFVSLDRSSVSYLVSASKPEAFELETWWFPVVGSVPYLGYFSEKDRDEKAKELIDGGYEVHKSQAAAFSSLGWFSDPIYSSMLRYDKTDFAHLIFHELTHKTAWIAGGVEFNENFAEFIADTLLESFLTASNQQNDLRDYRSRQLDEARLREWIRLTRQSLELAYKSDKTKDKKVWLSEKDKVIERALLERPKFSQVDLIGSRPWTVTRILASSLYSPDTTVFKKAFQCYESWASSRGRGVRLGDFIRGLKKSREMTENFVDAYCESLKP